MTCFLLTPQKKKKNCSSLVSGKRGNEVGQITAHGEEITKKRGGCKAENLEELLPN